MKVLACLTFLVFGCVCMGITHASSNDQVESPIVKKWLQDYGQVGKVENYSFKRSLGEFMESPIVKRMWQSYGQVGKVENYDFSRGKRSVDDQLESPMAKRMTRSYQQVGKIEPYYYDFKRSLGEFMESPIVKRMWQSYGQVGKVENYDFSRGKRSVGDQLESPIVKRMTQTYGQVGKVENYDYSRGKRMTQHFNGPIGELSQAESTKFDFPKFEFSAKVSKPLANNAQNGRSHTKTQRSYEPWINDFLTTGKFSIGNENYDMSSSRGKRIVDEPLESPLAKRMTQSYGQVGKVENYDYSRGKRMTQHFNGPIGELTQAAAVPNIELAKVEPTAKASK
jgi:hypothetical protein